MNAITVAALLIQLTTAGGASGTGARPAPRPATPGRGGDLGKDVAALKNEISSLKEEYRAARQKQRLAAEQKQQAEDARYATPTYESQK
ncbi:hypothetical protein DRW03_23760 [Corallococcus sp. H22C18031201]|uniref:hypothetical protein n=1 Tax=Citreicoccus inhibens TaxID=2849499 RepID=UPI000E74F300|nr:hypothetical protein [Citreicoccus inhibens]MBU8896603.1 hypothetical protein [Citreicoccus inhibens]RJS18693.1 hypothetical protein DRW03_23760 [Corallococcus sp. H22C18031201]